MRPLARELIEFARRSGYDATPCPGCGPANECCTNCGGSRRLWTSPRGSLSDEGVERLRVLLGDEA